MSGNFATAPTFQMALRSSIHNVRQKASIFADQAGRPAKLPTLGDINRLTLPLLYGI